ncbi:MAG: hypothetical protein H6728_03105 [Myxococcales bacterium]|nr:hypothetical protein [Myxococcales bacterium]
MFGWRWTRQFAGLLMGVTLLLLSSTAWAVRPWSELAAAWSRHQQRGQVIQQKRTHLRGKVKKLAQQIQKLKAEAGRGGLFALPTRMRLSSIRAKAQVWGQKLERSERAWRGLQQKQEILRREMLSVIRKNLYQLQMRWNVAKTKQQRQAIRQAIMVWSSHARMIHPALQAPKPARTIKVPVVRIDPLDGPAEIRQKVDTLRDQEDRIQRRMKKLQRRLASLQKEHKRNLKDQGLAQRVRDMTDDELFNEGSRNPRAAGREKKVAVAKGRENDSFTGTNGVQSPSTGTPQQGSTTTDGTRGTTSPPQSGGFNNEANAPPSKATPDPTPTTPTGTVQLMRPRLGLLPSERVHATSRDPMNPTGSLEEQIQALRRYKEKLKKQVRTLRKKQNVFLKKAQRIERIERQRRAKKRR